MEWEAWSLFASAFVSATLLPGGSEVLLMYWVQQQPAHAVFWVTIATLGNTLGAMTTWGLGWYAARQYPLETRLPAQRRQTIAWLRAKGTWPLLFAWLPIVGDGLCFAAGWLELSWRWSVLTIACGKGVRYAALAWWIV